MAELSVQIGAEIKELTKKLKEAQSRLNQFEKNANKSTKPLENKKAFNQGKKNFEKVGKSAANTTPTLQEFGRVIQDAPFGIIGVGNNLTQLVDNFTQLQKTTGSSKAAFKSLLSGLTGPAGISIAFSAIITLSTVFRKELSALGASFLGTSEDAKKLEETLSKNSGSARQEITTLQSLLSVAKDTEQSYGNRERALAKINDEYGDYLPNLTTENINTKEVADSVERLTKGLLRQAKIRGFQSAIEEKASEIASKTLKIQRNGQELVSQQLRETTKERRKALESERNVLNTLQKAYDSALGLDQQENAALIAGQIEDITKTLKQLESQTSATGQVIEKETLIADKIKKETESAERDLKGLGATLNDLIKEDIELEGVFTNTKSPDIEINPKVKTVSTLEVAKALDPLQNTIAQLETTANPINIIDPDSIPDLVKVRTELKEIVNSSGEKVLVRVEIPDDLIVDVSNLKNELTSLNTVNLDGFEQRLERAKAVTSSFGNIVGSTFSSLGGVVNQALGITDQVLSGFVNSVISSIGRLVSESITQLLLQQATEVAAQGTRSALGVAQIATNKAVAQSNAVLIASNAAAASGPAGPIVFPATLAALTAQIAGSFAGIAIPGFNTGGFVGDNNLVRTNGDELILNKLQQARLFTQLNTNTPRVSTGSLSDQNLSININSQIRGSDLILVAERAKRKQKRGL